jgi:hypothetical protein
MYATRKLLEKLTLKCSPHTYFTIHAKNLKQIDLESLDVVANPNSDEFIIETVECDTSINSTSIILEGQEKPLKFQNAKSIKVTAPVFSRNIKVLADYYGLDKTEFSNSVINVSKFETDKLLVGVGQVGSSQDHFRLTSKKSLKKPMSVNLNKIKATRRVTVKSDDEPVKLTANGEIVCKTLEVLCENKDSSANFNANVKTFNLDLVSGDFNAEKVVYTERGVANVSRGDIKLSGLHVNQHFAATTDGVANINVKEIEGPGSIVLTSTNMDLWLAETCKDITLYSEQKINLNLSDKIKADLSVDTKIDNETKYRVLASQEGFNLKNSRKDIPNVGRRMEFTNSEETPTKIKVIERLNCETIVKKLPWMMARMRKMEENIDIPKIWPNREEKVPSNDELTSLYP